MKQVAKDLVAKNRLQEKDDHEVLKEFRKSGGYGSSCYVVKGVKRLRARSHCGKRNAKRYVTVHDRC